MAGRRSVILPQMLVYPPPHPPPRVLSGAGCLPLRLLPISDLKPFCVLLTEGDRSGSSLGCLLQAPISQHLFNSSLPML